MACRIWSTRECLRWLWWKTSRSCRRSSNSIHSKCMHLYAIVVRWLDGSLMRLLHHFKTIRDVLRRRRMRISATITTTTTTIQPTRRWSGSSPSIYERPRSCNKLNKKLTLEVNGEKVFLSQAEEKFFFVWKVTSILIILNHLSLSRRWQQCVWTREWKYIDEKNTTSCKRGKRSREFSSLIFYRIKWKEENFSFALFLPFSLLLFLLSQHFHMLEKTITSEAAGAKEMCNFASASKRGREWEMMMNRKAMKSSRSKFLWEREANKFGCHESGRRGRKRRKFIRNLFCCYPSAIHFNTGGKVWIPFNWIANWSCVADEFDCTAIKVKVLCQQTL